MIPAFWGGCQRLVKRSTVLGALEQRISTVEYAPSNAGLASRVGSLEQWRQNKAAAISDASTDMGGMGVSVAGVNVASTSAVQYLKALRREQS
ncbi:hypothetical protein [Modicisalibacter coralii]|uniref:hypothetical protein n=1 Tax=Modicisalibacter coralii TaxID=2304602 RepID=UPI00100ACD6B|nr:hypothetical protein [Halomonas coralii]